MTPLKFSGVYPPNFSSIAYAVKKSNHWRCERCYHKLDSLTSDTLGVYPLDGNRGNTESWNLAALCQGCHLHIQQFNLEALLLIYDSPGIFGNNEPWLKSHIAGIKKAVNNKKVCSCGIKVYLKSTNDLRWGHRFAWFDDQGNEHDGILCRLQKHNNIKAVQAGVSPTTGSRCHSASGETIPSSSSFSSPPGFRGSGPPQPGPLL